MSLSTDIRQGVLDRVQEYVDGKSGAVDLGHYLDVLSTGLDLYPPEPVMDLGQAAGQILERKPEAAVTAMLQLVSSDSRQTRALACVMISRLAKYNPGIWAGVIRHLDEDADWEVRSYAARVYDSREGYSGAVEFHTDWVFEELASWVVDQNYLRRYAATQALLGYVQIQPDVSQRVLDLLHPVLDDSAEYVRRGHVMALRTMGRNSPAAVFDYIAKNTPPPSGEAKETFRLVLEASFAAKDPQRKQELLAQVGE